MSSLHWTSEDLSPRSKQASSSLSADLDRIRAASGTIRVTYWAGRGRCEPLRNIIAAGGGQMENIFFETREQMLALIETGKLEYDQLPLVEVDGLNLVQSTAAAIYLGQRFGLYPQAPEHMYTVNHIFASAADARGGIIGFPFSRTDPEAKLASFKLDRYGAAWEAQLAGSGGPFFLGEAATIADVAVFEALDFYQDISVKYLGQTIEQALAAYPLLTAHYVTVKGLGRLEEWMRERERLFLPYDVYAQNVMVTLGRA